MKHICEYCWNFSVLNNSCKKSFHIVVIEAVLGLWHIAFYCSIKCWYGGLQATTLKHCQWPLIITGCIPLEFEFELEPMLSLFFILSGHLSLVLLLCGWFYSFRLFLYIWLCFLNEMTITFESYKAEKN